MPITTDKLNRSIAQRVVDDIAAVAAHGSTVAILGLSYKPHSHVIEESQAMQIIKALVDRQYRVVGYDPLAGGPANQELVGRALIFDSIASCLEDADVVLIANADPAFKTLTAEHFRRGTRQVTVIDFWRYLAPALTGAPGINYVRYGCGPDLAESADGPLSALWAATAASFLESV